LVFHGTRFFLDEYRAVFAVNVTFPKEGLMRGFDVQLRIKHFAEIETSRAG
jgi:hypothetical protein